MDARQERFFTLALSAVSGFVDTAGYVLLFGLFTAHVTGNFVLAGAAFISHGSGEIWGRLGTLPVFALGVATSALLVRRLEERGRETLTPLLVSEALMLALFATAGESAGSAVGNSPGTLTVFLVGSLGVLAMAIQNAAMRLALGTLPPTTVMTGNLTGFTLDCFEYLTSTTERRERVASRLARSVPALLGFSGGAVAGAILGGTVHFWSMAVPIAVLLILALRAGQGNALPIMLGACLLTVAGSAQAQVPEPLPSRPLEPGRPALNAYPQDSSWEFLRDPTRCIDFWDRLKFVPLGNGGSSYFSFGLEYRTEYETIRNNAFDAGPQSDSGYSLQRLLPHAEWRASPVVHVYTEFQFAFENGRNGGPRPRIDQNAADVHQMFVELKGTVADATLQARVGRQELIFGSGRLLDNSDGVNVKASFDGLRLSLQQQRWRFDLLAVRPVTVRDDLFQAWPDHRQTLWGLYTAGPSPVDSKGGVEIYYLGLDSKRSVYQKGSGREIRHSGGVRVFRKAGAGWDYNWEPVVQWGSFAGRSIRAWTVATETGYTFANRRWQPRLAVRSDAASGDQDPHSAKLGTFNPLYPRGAYYGPKLSVFGPYNIVDGHGALLLRPYRTVTVDIDFGWFWRESTRDGIYTNSGSILKTGTLSQARFIGSRGGLGARWAVSRHLTAAAQFSGMIPGRFLKETPPGRTLLFFNGGLTYRF